MPAPDYAAEIADLERQLASELTVESQGDRVTNRSVADLERSLDYFRRKATEAAAPGRRPSFGFSAVAFCRD